MDESPTVPSDDLEQQTGREMGKRPHRVRKALLGIAIAFFVVDIVGLALMFGLPFSTPRSNAEDPPNRTHAPGVVTDIPSVVGEVSSGQVAIPSKAPADPRLSFLLLGYGGGGHEGAYLTDSIMVVVADPNQKTLTMLSLPRDSWVPFLFDSKTAVYNKLNTAYALAKDASLYSNRVSRYTGSRGPGNLVTDTVSRLLGVPLGNYLALDFAGFREMINTVGGIDVNVPTSFAARYPVNDDPSIDPSWMIVRFNKGAERMNGERAIQFARARETIDNVSEGSDFARSRRQRIIMESFKSRLLDPGGLIHLPQLLGIAARHVDTDYGLGDVAQLNQLLLGWKDVRIYQTALTGANYLTEATGPAGSYVVVPTAPAGSWAQVRAFVHRLWEDPATAVAMADTRIVILNNTGKPGVATRLSAALVKLGYRVGPPESGPGRTESRLIDRTGGKAKLVAAQLKKDLGVDFQEVAEAVSGSDVLVLDLGSKDEGIANIVIPEDAGAPSSAFGIQKFGEWVPEVAPPPDDEQTEASPTASPQRISTPRPGTSPTSTLPLTGTLPANGTPTSQASRTPGPTRTPTPMGTPRPTAPPTKAPDATPQQAPTATATPPH